MSQIFAESFLCGSGALAAMDLAVRSWAGEVAPTTPWMEEVQPRLEQRPRAALPPGLVGLRHSLVDEVTQQLKVRDGR